MSKIDEIKEAIASAWPDFPAATMCVRLVDFVAHTPDAETRMLTIPVLAHGVGLERVDRDLLDAITILVSSRFELLQARAMVIKEDDEEFEVGPAELSRARHSGALIDPQSGEAISDFESKVFPFFVPTDRFRTLIAAEHGS